MPKHQKRLSASKVVAIPKKGKTWMVAPSPGPHPSARSLPLLIAVRDRLGLVDTSKEARYIIGSREVMVDQTIVGDYKRPLGLMDTVSIPKVKQSYRVVLDKKGRLQLTHIEEKEAAWKLCRIEGKTTLKGGKTQLNLHDGRNVLVEKDTYKTGDTLKIELPTQKILAHHPLAKGATAMVIGGSHTGSMASVSHRIPKKGSSEDLIELEGGVRTVRSHIFVVGSGRAEVTVPEVIL
jgi:small subunit ribosomal protein S4e